MKKVVREEKEDAVKELYEALLLLKTTDEISRFFNDLCTPKEIKSLGERWRVCKLLDQGSLSYRDINNLTGASLVTIGRVARFLKTEPHHGYALILDRLAKKNKRTT
ncbi:MAG: YerC/YecD family TrpR-related protein [Candidatus Babeliales bacterium]